MVEGIWGRLGQNNLILLILIHVIAISFFFPKLGHMFLNYNNFLFYEYFREGHTMKYREITLFEKYQIWFGEEILGECKHSTEIFEI